MEEGAFCSTANKRKDGHADDYLFKVKKSDSRNTTNDDSEKPSKSGLKRRNQKKRRMQNTDEENDRSRATSATTDSSFVIRRISQPLSNSVFKFFGRRFRRSNETDASDHESVADRRSQSVSNIYQKEVVHLALSTKHILKTIIKSSSPKQILTCRLVSKTWDSAASSILHQRLAFHFFRGKQSFETLKGKRLEELTNFLDKTYSGLPNTFPCTRYIFHGPGLSNKSFQIFLNVQGNYIKELSILDCCRFSHKVQIIEAHENEVMDQVKYLLTTQTPNLEFFELDIRPIVEWEKDTTPSTRGVRSPVKIDDPEYQRIRSKEFTKELKLNENLKEFYFGGSPSSKLFEMVIKLAPKLNEVSMVEDNYAWLMEPFNRRHLLKHLQLYGQERAVVKKIAMTRSISFDSVCKPKSMYRYSNFDRYFEIVDWKPPYQLETIVLINRVLRCCSSSIETICWQPVNIFKELAWPQMMPNVTKLLFSSPLKAELAKGKIPRLFAEEFKIRKIFPQLKTIVFHVFEGRKNFLYLIQSWNFRSIPTVTHVIISCFCFPRKRISKRDLKPIGILFPNAKVDVNEYYEVKKKDALHQVLIPRD